MAAPCSELATEEWVGVYQQAAKLGVLHLHLTGGEPLARADLTQLVDAAHAAGLYTNLITSGIGLSEPRLMALVSAGLDHVQLSFQNSRESSADWIAGTRAHALKVELAPMICFRDPVLLPRLRAVRPKAFCFFANLRRVFSRVSAGVDPHDYFFDKSVFRGQRTGRIRGGGVSRHEKSLAAATAEVHGAAITTSARFGHPLLTAELLKSI